MSNPEFEKNKASRENGGISITRVHGDPRKTDTWKMNNHILLQTWVHEQDPAPGESVEYFNLQVALRRHADFLSAVFTKFMCGPRSPANHFHIFKVAKSVRDNIKWLTLPIMELFGTVLLSCLTNISKSLVGVNNSECFSWTDSI